ncbi:V-set and transmembrane domain-containing protein 5 [Suncus etruscus]|uniref:V-set and transmembrane domain-containing protein 5 n=1 Tax=Suncus etruscus TaxID=109475 RepID=UPI00210F9C0F|nr:V-set and transmembrane domain-containing protein 5 [Suncus etruscus]
MRLVRSPGHWRHWLGGCGVWLSPLGLCLGAACGLQGPGVALYVAQVAINATVAEDVLLSVAFSCPGVPTIEWRYASHKGAQRIVAWQPGTQAHVAPSHQHRVCTFDNGSLQLLRVGPHDAGVYVVTVSEQLLGSSLGTVALHVSEVLYEDLHFVAVVLAFLTAVGAVLAGLLWVCNRCGRLWKQRLLTGGSSTERVELQDMAY